MSIEVKATARGYYNGLREEGDVFRVANEKAIGSWMVRTDQIPKKRKPADPAPDPTTAPTARQQREDAAKGDAGDDPLS